MAPPMESRIDARTLFLGDWSRWVRDPIDLFRLTFPIGVVVVWLVRDDWPLNLTVSTIAVYAVRPMLLPRLYDLAFCIAFALTGWGDALGLYESLSFYDNIVHVLVPLFSGQVLYILLARIELVPDPRDHSTHGHYAGLFVVTAALGLAVGALWEIVEWATDSTVGSDLQLGNEDTVTDLLSDAAGAFAGAGLLVAWAVYGWGSVRRIPDENRAEETNA
jgi:uncharacterized membrane protein YjdF